MKEKFERSNQNYRSCSQKVHREPTQPPELPQLEEMERDVYFYHRRWKPMEKPESKQATPSKYESLHLNKDEAAVHKKTFKRWVEQEINR